jgi:hypothetical protein
MNWILVTVAKHSATLISIILLLLRILRVGLDVEPSHRVTGSNNVNRFSYINAHVNDRIDLHIPCVGQKAKLQPNIAQIQPKYSPSLDSNLRILCRASLALFCRSRINQVGSSCSIATLRFIDLRTLR